MRVIFACVHNAGRSQMAAAFFNALAHPDRARALSAGTEPAAQIHREVLTAMREAGIELSGARPQRLTAELAATAGMLITMGCGEACPVVPGIERADWPVDDPTGQPPERVRAIREEIRARVAELVAERGWREHGHTAAPREEETGMRTRLAAPGDAPAIARIYNEGIEDRIATFETRPRSAEDVARWFDGVHPIVVVEDAGRVVGFASTSAYRPRECYAAIAEFSVYVARERRGTGVGRRALAALVAAAADAGLHKLVSRIFPENTASRAMCRAVGFREVGVYQEHGQLEGAWRDCVIVERLVGR